MDELNTNNDEIIGSETREPDAEKLKDEEDSQYPDANMSQAMFPESPVYDVEALEQYSQDMCKDNKIPLAENAVDDSSDNKNNQNAKRKLSDGDSNDTEHNAKVTKLNEVTPSNDTQCLDEEVSKINEENGKKTMLAQLNTTPVKASPKKISKRSSSTDTPRTPRAVRSRPASADITQDKTPSKCQVANITKDILMNIPEEIHIVSSESSTSRPSVEFVKEIAPSKDACETIEENNTTTDLNDSQNFHLELSPSPDDSRHEEEKPNPNHSSDPVVVRDREEVLNPDKVEQTRSEGYNYSDVSSNLSQMNRPIDSKDKATDQESTDSVGSLNLESPDTIPNVASKLISKLSNGNSSTPTDNGDGIGMVISISDNDSDSTPDMNQLNGKKKRGKIDVFKMSNTTTPSTISPLQNGHSIPANTPQIPMFDVHVSHNEDGEFLSLYVVKTDNDVGIDMYKEYQRFSKRFTIDPYMADVSVNNSPSSVTSTGMINLPNRTSFASTTSSSTSTSSNRTSDGNFVVPQPPRKSLSHPSSATVRGCEALLKKLQDIFSHVRDTSMHDGNRSVTDDKISIGVQASPLSDNTVSNGNASPQEVSNCDKATPKSSLKKTRVRGRRPLAGKTKRAIILPTQVEVEEPECVPSKPSVGRPKKAVVMPTQLDDPDYMHGMNSPEMVPTNTENDKDDKPLSTLIGTPKSVSKLKTKRIRPVSPRPATPVEKPAVKSEYPGYPADTVVLAKWVDKRYYSGRVLEITEPNKYLIKFDDGQSKTLLDDFIIFGDHKTLPLEGQSVYAMVDEEQNYEPGLVLGVEENEKGTVTYRCTTDGDTTVNVTASELYLTEDQARSMKESNRPKSPNSAPSTPRRRGLRELDLDNIITGPRSARSRDKGNSSARKRVASPRSPKASTSGIRPRAVVVGRQRACSSSSSVSESSGPAAAAAVARVDHVPGVEPELQRTPRKIAGVKAGPLQLKGAAKQNPAKKNSKLAKWETDAATISALGPIPAAESGLFADMHFLLTCTEPPAHNNNLKSQESRHYSSEEDGESSSAMATDTEDLEFSDKPFNKERLKEQLEAGGGTVYSHFDDVPRNKYSQTKLIAPRPCLTAKYIQCLAGGVRALSHAWVIASCAQGNKADTDAFTLPPGFSLLRDKFADWDPPSGKRNTQFFKDKLILLCGEQDTFVKFWERVGTLAGANTRTVNEEDLNMSGAIACVAEWDCPHEVQNKATQDNVPLVSTTWLVQCLIEGKVIPPTSHDKFSFMYTEPE